MTHENATLAKGVAPLGASASAWTCTPRVGRGGLAAPAPRSDSSELPWVSRALDALRRAAVDAEQHLAQAAPLAPLWQSLSDGRLELRIDWFGPTRSYAVARVARSGAETRSRFDEQEACVMLRVLCGDAQKVVADELRIAKSTASKRYSCARAKLGLSGRPVPLPVVLAAQSVTRMQATCATGATFVQEGREFVVVSVPRPATAGLTILTPSERDVFTLYLEGQSRHGIAESRATSTQTASSQLRSIFSKLRVSGRYEAIRVAAESGCFR